MRNLSDCRILIVDDAKTNVDILVEGLKSDYKLSVAFSGESALQIASRMPPDLVLLDIMMPGLDGYEVCRRLRTMPETAEVPVMFLSSLEEVQNKTLGFEVGANDYLTKPYEMLEVKARVRSLLKAKAYNDAVKEQIASELRVARQIQMGMIPHDFEGICAAYGVELDALLEPAREVGGDLYGVCTTSPERLVLFIGDVSGKGIPASMFMVRAISLAKLLSREIVSPERILSRLNDELAVDNPSGMFVTFLCVVFEPANGRLSISNAGHCRPLLIRKGRPAGWAVSKLGTALGFTEGLSFEKTELTLLAGDTLLLYTDGVSESFNPAEECYGSGRLLSDVEDLSGTPVSELTSGLLKKVRGFSGTAPQSDDIAILALRVGTGTPVTGNSVVRMQLHATPEDVMRAVDTLEQCCLQWQVPEKSIFGLKLALEECSSNIVNHSLKRDMSRTFSVIMERTADSVIIELRDGGPEFDPTRVTMPEDAVTREGREPGGWGIRLARRYVDEILYKREEEQNVLRLIKKIEMPVG